MSNIFNYYMFILFIFLLFDNFNYMDATLSCFLTVTEESWVSILYEYTKSS